MWLSTSIKKLLVKGLQVTQASYKNHQKDFNGKRGIFQKSLQCYGQHETSASNSSALAGNDVHKLTKNENISNISTVSKPLLINYQMI